MRIGIDVSQLAYPNTGVANYLQSLISEVIKNSSNEYVLFFSSLRGQLPASVREFQKLENVTIKSFKIPPTILNIMWNSIHKVPIENFVGNVDVFITSDWTEPPSKKAKKATILYDLIVYKYPEETDSKIISTQKMKLRWVKKEADIVFCISESTKKDAEKLLGIDSKKLKVIYPGL